MAHIHALCLLTALVNDIHLPLPTAKQATKHRKAACHFRDNLLLPLFTTAISQLNSLSTSPMGSSEQTMNILQATLNLIKACFTFDFIGAGSDEPTDDVGTLQIPHSWKNTILESPLISLLFNLASSDSPVTALALDILSLAFSARKSLFNTEERTQFMATIFNHSTILLQKAGNPDTLEEMARLLVRVKASYQTADLTDSQGFDNWIAAVTEFCIKALQSDPDHTVFVYILTFWSKIALSILSGSDKADVYKRLESSCAGIVNTFLAAYVRKCGVEEGDVQQVAELGSGVARAKYPEAVDCVINIFDEIAGIFLRTKSGAENIAMCIYFMGSFLRARPPFGVGISYHSRSNSNH